MKQGLSLRAVANTLGYSVSALHEHRKKGAFKALRDGSYDLDAVREGLLKRTIPSAEHKARLSSEKPAGRTETSKLSKLNPTTLSDIKKLLEADGFDTSGGLTHELVRTAEGLARAYERMLRIAVRRRELVELRGVQEHGRNIAIGFKRAMQNIPARVADEIAAKLGCNAHDLEREMSQAIRDTLDQLANTVAPE